MSSERSEVTLPEASGPSHSSAEPAEPSEPASRPVTAAARGAAGPPGRWPSLPLAFIHLAALWSIAFVQPLFDLLGRNAGFFVARDNTAGDVLIFAFVLTLVPPLAMTVLLSLVRAISARGGRVALCGLVSLLGAGFVLQVLKRVLPDDSAVLIPLALVLGGVLGWLYARRPGWRTGATVLGPVPVVFLVLFLLFSPVNDLVLPQSPTVQAAGTGTSRTPVVFIVLDEVPAISLMDEDMAIDRRRWPNFARLAASSTWYRNTTTVGDGTQVAVPAILTGLRPRRRLPPPTARTYPHSLFTLLGRRYTQHVEEPITHVCPATLCRVRARRAQSARLSSLASDLRIVLERIVLPSDIGDTLPPVDRDWESFTANGGDDGLADVAESTAGPSTIGGLRIAGSDLTAQRVRDGRAVVHSIAPSPSRPDLWMVHYVIPHVPWRFVPGGSQYAVDGPNMPGLGSDQTWGANRFLLDQGMQRHLLQLGFADTLLGEVIDRLKAAGIWNRALLVVVADHGGSVRANVLRRPVTKANFAEIANVPLFIKVPGQRAGSIDDRPRETVDVMPTVAKVLDAGRGWRFDGVPVGAARRAGFRPRVRNGRAAESVSVSFKAFLRQRATALRRQLRRFPADPAAVWRVGPAQELLGRRISTLPRSGAAGRGRVANRALYRRVNPSRTGVVPSYVTGRLSGIPPGRTLAIAVNGTIRATSESYSVGGRVRFSGLVPPSAFRRGRNDVRVLLVDGGRLREVAHA